MNQKLADVASLSIGAIEEIENKKANKPEYISVCITTENWKSDDNFFPYYYDIPLQNVTEKDHADIILSIESIQIAENCGLCSIIKTISEAVRIRANSPPTEAITAEIILTKG